MPDPDDDLRRLAHRALAEEVATVDVDAGLGAIRQRLESASPFPTVAGRHRWWAAAAATLLVVTGVSAIAWTASRDDGSIGAPPTAPAPPGSAAPAPDSVAPAGTAIAEPAVVVAGHRVTIIPAGGIERNCSDIVIAAPVDVSSPIGLLTNGTWDATEPTMPACIGDTTAESLTFVVAADLPPGRWNLCIGDAFEPAGCALVTVVAPGASPGTEPSATSATSSPGTAPGSSVATSPPGSAPAGTRVAAGGVVTISPSRATTRDCNETIAVTRLDEPAAGRLGFIREGRWYADPLLQVDVELGACNSEPSADALTFVVPRDVPAGRYEMCLARPSGDLVDPGPDQVGCTTVEVLAVPEHDCFLVAVAPPTSADGSAPGEAATEPPDQPGLPWRVRWGAAAPAAVWQHLGTPPASWERDVAVASGTALAAGTYRALVVPVGDPPSGDIWIDVVDLSARCTRRYVVGEGVTAEAAQQLAQAWIDALAAQAPEPLRQPGVPYFVRETIQEPPYFAISDHLADGTRIGRLSDTGIAALYPPTTLADGSTVALDGDLTDLARCENLPLVRSNDGAVGPLHAVARVARSFAVTPDGRVLAFRDVCPDGTRWGDAGTRLELLVLDPAAPDDPPEVVLSVDAEPDQLLFDDGARIRAAGELRIDHVSLDGRYAAVADPYNSEDLRWHVLDLAEHGFVDLPSACALPGQIAAPPRFLDDAVVVARLCANQRTTAEHPQASIGSGDLQVEVIELATRALESSSSIPGAGAHSYSRTANVSARRADDGTIWVLLTANGGVDQESAVYLLHEGRSGRVGSPEWAFSAADLIHPWDQPPG